MIIIVETTYLENKIYFNIKNKYQMEGIIEVNLWIFRN